MNAEKFYLIFFAKKDKVPATFSAHIFALSKNSPKLILNPSKYVLAVKGCVRFSTMLAVGITYQK